MFGLGGHFGAQRLPMFLMFKPALFGVQLKMATTPQKVMQVQGKTTPNCIFTQSFLGLSMEDPTPPLDTPEVFGTRSQHLAVGGPILLAQSARSEVLELGEEGDPWRSPFVVLFSLLRGRLDKRNWGAPTPLLLR